MVEVPAYGGTLTEGNYRHAEIHKPGIGIF